MDNVGMVTFETVTAAPLAASLVCVAAWPPVVLSGVSLLGISIVTAAPLLSTGK